MTLGAAVWLYPLIDPAGESLEGQAQDIVEIGDFVGLRLQVTLTRMGQNEVENQQSRLN